MSNALEQAQRMRASWQLSQWLDWQESLHPKAWDLGLARISEVWQRLDCGRIAERVLIVAGTNGKGSTVRWTEAIALAHGIKVATFTSPHVQDYRERIRFDGALVDEATLCDAFQVIDRARGEISLTYFEWSALAAFYLMANASLALAILEVGLGGRLDATNIIDADAAIITRIGLDHQDWLGDDVETIAREKAGVLRRGQLLALPVERPPQAVLEQASDLAITPWRLHEELSVSIDGDDWTVAVPGYQAQLPLPKLLPGKHQCAHIAAVLSILAQWFVLDVHKLAAVMRETALIGRLTKKKLHHTADILFDVAHNADSAEILAAFLREQRRHYQRVHVICGMLRDKDHQAVFGLLAPVVDSWSLCRLSGPRASHMDDFYQAALSAGIDEQIIHQYDDCPSAKKGMDEQASADDLVVVMGSFITVGELLHEWDKQ
ncbi:bifunctional folylpolyglutamate synthase/dihydrofolate synthase [Suttonella sp. R2A3]|uniref:bifunctional folylpolyglutamate synthase/dihydrofolate synthase n=1 Tax=Suttonella sp. R2A3 TaxID=2908648 RepID=UPI001F27809E|nr:folylpolyglutamate synthase/dihydrofolate synthase family protein [Suttonella sp. R2A3]UJF24728.1 bifunctional folylpolyglutamate synthase/dihydrofolate synthase [Suttonella sp. R2A3]